MSQPPFYIYALVHIEDNNRPFYIGRGTDREQRTEERYKNHLWKAKVGSPLPVHRKIRQIQALGQNIRYEERGRYVTMENVMTQEMYLISEIGLDNLTNVSPGGDDYAWVRGQVPNFERKVVKSEQAILNHRKGSKKKAVILTDMLGQQTLHESTKAADRAISAVQGLVWNRIKKGGTAKGYTARYASEEDFLKKW